MEGMYSLEDLTKSIIAEYDLINPVKDYKTYRQRIRRALEDAGLLDKGSLMTNPVTKRKCVYYSEFHKQTILHDKQLYDYVRKHSASDEYKNGPRYRDLEQQIRDYREANIRALDSSNINTNQMDTDYSGINCEHFKAKKHKRMTDNEARQAALNFLSLHQDRATTDTDYCGPTSEDVKAKKYEMMLEAVFSVFFTPFKEELLQRDMERLGMHDSAIEPDVGDVEALTRFSHPEGSYFKRKSSSEG